MPRSRLSIDTGPSPARAVGNRSRSLGSTGALARRLVLVVAVALHLAAGTFYLAAGLVAPMWAVLLLWAAWIGLLWVLVRLWHQRAMLALLVTPASLGLFLSALSAGEAWLGWVA